MLLNKLWRDAVTRTSMVYCRQDAVIPTVKVFNLALIQSQNFISCLQTWWTCQWWSLEHTTCIVVTQTVIRVKTKNVRLHCNYEFIPSPPVSEHYAMNIHSTNAHVFTEVICHIVSLLITALTMVQYEQLSQYSDYVTGWISLWFQLG
jgi:hypothetical protein